MSTQSAQSVKKSTMYLDSGSSMSNSQIVEAADVAFSHHRRLDTGTDFSSNHDDDVSCNPLADLPNSRLHLRKRKRDFESARSDFAATDFNTDFLSGIFRDISQAEQDGSVPCDVKNTTVDDNVQQTSISDGEYIRVKKKVKTRGTIHSMSRNRKSFTCLQNVSSNQVGNTQLGASAKAARRVSVSSPKYISDEMGSDTGVLNASCIHFLVDKVLEESLVFPRLPPTVSESSYNSNSLTQTSVQAAQGTETNLSSNTEGEGSEQRNKDTYGWFVDMDLEEDSDRADVISAAQESCRASVCEELSFKAFTAPKKTSLLDEELEWAKAADTVDDVLGDFF